MRAWAGVVGCSDGSVYHHKHAGGYAWGLYERKNSDLCEIGINGYGREKHENIESHSIHSYRVEALALLAALTFLRERKWRGRIEWHMDCQSAITTYGKIEWHNYTNWYAQRDKDVWERLQLERKHWGGRLTIHHVKAHTDTIAGHECTSKCAYK